MRGTISGLDNILYFQSSWFFEYLENKILDSLFLARIHDFFSYPYFVAPSGSCAIFLMFSILYIIDTLSLCLIYKYIFSVILLFCEGITLIEKGSFLICFQNLLTFYFSMIFLIETLNRTSHACSISATVFVVIIIDVSCNEKDLLLVNIVYVCVIFCTEIDNLNDYPLGENYIINYCF